MRVLGIDACVGGWVGVVATEGERVRLRFGRTIGELLAAVEGDGGLDAIGIDIPIGLADDSVRRTDALARAALGPRRSSIFASPVRAALRAPTHAEFSTLHRERTGSGLSVQAYRIAPKIAEVDDHLAAGGRMLTEVHPELSFATLAGLPGAPVPLAHAKRTWAGAEERRRLLDSVGLLPGSPPDRAGSAGRAGRADAEETNRTDDDRAGAHAAPDDVLDAAIVAWTAFRIARGTAVRRPDPPEVFSDGLEAAIFS